MSETFDAYHQWLGIPPTEQPPNHYRLLGIALFESDANVISNAADRQMAHLQTFKTGKYSALSQQLLNQVAGARVCLLNAVRKAEYDGALRKKQADATRPDMMRPSRPVLAPVDHGTIPLATRPVPVGAPAQTPLPAAQRDGAPRLQLRQLWPALIPALLVLFALMGWLFSPSSSSRRSSADRRSAARRPAKVSTSSVNEAPPLDERKGPSAKVQIERTVKTETTATMKLVLRKSHLHDREAGQRSLPKLRIPAMDVSVISSPPDTKMLDTSALMSADSDSPVAVERLKSGPLVKLSGGFTKIEDLRGAVVFRPVSSDPETLAESLQFKVNRAGVYYLAITWKREADPPADRVSREQLVEQGWEDLGSSPWDKECILLKRTCKAGESFRIRTNKYLPPYLIVPAGQWKKAEPSAAP